MLFILSLLLIAAFIIGTGLPPSPPSLASPEASRVTGTTAESVEAEDVIDRSVFVVPEVPLGSLGIITASVAGLLGFAAARRQATRLPGFL